MGSSSSKPAVTTQNTTSDPWAGAQPAMRDTISAAGQLYNQGSGTNVYGGNLVAPINADQQSGANMMASIVQNGHPLADTAYGAANTLIQNQGIDPRMQGALSQLQSTSDGANIGTINPALQNRLDYLSQNAANKVNSSMSGAGRYGSGMHTAALAREVGGATSGLLAQDYADERNRQLQASGLLGQIYGSGSDRALQASGMAGALDQNRFADASRISGWGDFQQQQQQQMLAADQARFDAQNSAPWDNLARYNAIATGAGALGSTKTGFSVAPQAQGGGAKGALGGAVAGASLGSAFGPVGTAAGGLLGGLGGYFAK